MTPFATTNTIYYDPITSTTSTSTTSPTVYTTIGPTSFSFSYENTKEKMKEYCDKVDQHVDKLEEDIDFLNNERIELKQTVANQQAQIDLLKTQLETMNDKLNSLEGLVHWIEDHVNVEVNI